jgi:methionine synthase I (cobalamin-dependent)
VVANGTCENKEIYKVDWRQMLDHWGILLADGAWGTEIEKRGLAVGECPERWNLEHPDQIREIAASYLEAGAQIVLPQTEEIWVN